MAGKLLIRLRLNLRKVKSYWAFAALPVETGARPNTCTTVSGIRTQDHRLLSISCGIEAARAPVIASNAVAHCPILPDGSARAAMASTVYCHRLPRATTTFAGYARAKFAGDDGPERMAT